MPKKLTDLEYQKAFDEAFKAAEVACEEYLQKYPNDWYPCGFAWVVFDGRDPAVKFLKKSEGRYGRRAGDKGYPKGWHIWDPANSPTQVMEAKSAGARAFCQVLAKYGIDAYSDCRMD